jgi:hypothetical protein
MRSIWCAIPRRQDELWNNEQDQERAHPTASKRSSRDVWT